MAHVKLEKYMEEFYDEARNMLENVPDDEQILTWREISHLSLDCQQMETIYEIVKEAYWLILVFTMYLDSIPQLEGILCDIFTFAYYPPTA